MAKCLDSWECQGVVLEGERTVRRERSQTLSFEGGSHQFCSQYWETKTIRPTVTFLPTG